MIAASLHYFRHRRDAVSAALTALRGLGVDTVESPVPWSVHDDGGRVAFDGDGAHLSAFLEEAARAGLSAVLRLGPFVGADLTGLGLPRHVAGDRQLAARHRDGSPHVVPVPPRWLVSPSCFSRAYRERAAAWVAAAAGAIRPFLFPSGPVRTVLLGDVWPFGGRNPAGSPDFHPDALAAWEEVRDAAPEGERGRLIAAEPCAVSSSAAAAVLEGIGVGRFHERGAIDFLRSLGDAVAGVFGGGATLAASLPPAGLFPPVGAGLLARSFDAVGLDVFGWPARSGSLDRDARLVAGSVRRPFASFVSVGAPTWLPHLADADPLYGVQVCLAAGLNGLVLSMGVGRDRWCGGLLDEALHEHESAHRFRRLLHGLGRSRWLHGRRRPLAALLVPRDYVRGAFASSAALIGPPGAGFAGAFGFPPAGALDGDDRSPGGGAWWRWFEAAESALQELGVDYELVDDEGPLAVEAPLLLVPTLEDVPAATAERLRAQVARGAAVLLGPSTPRRELATGAELSPGLPAPATLPTTERIADALGAARVAAPVPRLERSLHFDEAGAVVGLAVVNRSPRDVPLGLALEHLPRADAGRVGGPIASGQPTVGSKEPRTAWSDLDEPGSAQATGSVPAGGFRLLVPGARRKEGP